MELWMRYENSSARNFQKQQEYINKIINSEWSSNFSKWGKNFCMFITTIHICVSVQGITLKVIQEFSNWYLSHYGLLSVQTRALAECIFDPFIWRSPLRLQLMSKLLIRTRQLGKIWIPVWNYTIHGTLGSVPQLITPFDDTCWS